MLNFFEKFPEITAVMSERTDGSMKIFNSEPEINSVNRENFFGELRIDSRKIYSAEIVHGTKIQLIRSEGDHVAWGADGLLTDRPGVFLSVTVADCIPLFLYEPKVKICGILHCGWRGIVNGIVPEAVEKISEMGGDSQMVQAVLGPGIGACHFEIKEGILDNFKKHSLKIVRRGGKIFADLKGIMTEQLLESRVMPENISDSSICTFENKRFFSFRRDRPQIPEAMIAIIGIKE